jgi:tol-pal system protein YbgF
MTIRDKLLRFQTIPALLVLATAVMTWQPVQAQDVDVDRLLQRLERLERDLQDLQRSYYRGDKPKKTSAALAAGGAPASGPRLAQAEVRMSRLETQMRELTGRVEQVQHGIDSVRSRLDKLVADVDFRLTQIEGKLRAGGVPIASGDASPGAATQGQQQQAAASRLTQSTPAGSTTAATGAPAPKTVQKTSVSPQLLPQGNAADRYNFAFSLLRKADFARAELAFTEFLALHGDDRLAGNAYYWLGETYYSRNKLQDAARTFLSGFEKFPDGVKAPDTLLKLAITLSRMDQREEACATLSELKKRFATLSRSVGQRHDREWRNNKCG